MKRKGKSKRLLRRYYKQKKRLRIIKLSIMHSIYSSFYDPYTLYCYKSTYINNMSLKFAIDKYKRAIKDKGCAHNCGNKRRFYNGKNKDRLTRKELSNIQSYEIQIAEVNEYMKM